MQHLAEDSLFSGGQKPLPTNPMRHEFSDVYGKQLLLRDSEKSEEKYLCARPKKKPRLIFRVPINVLASFCTALDEHCGTPVTYKAVSFGYIYTARHITVDRAGGMRRVVREIKTPPKRRARKWTLSIAACAPSGHTRNHSQRCSHGYVCARCS